MHDKLAAGTVRMNRPIVESVAAGIGLKYEGGWLPGPVYSIYYGEWHMGAEIIQLIVPTALSKQRYFLTTGGKITVNDSGLVLHDTMELIAFFPDRHHGYYKSLDGYIKSVEINTGGLVIHGNSGCQSLTRKALLDPSIYIANGIFDSNNTTMPHMGDSKIEQLPWQQINGSIFN